MTEKEQAETPASVPYFVYEGQAARHERASRRLLLALVLAVLLIVVSNLAWLWAWCQYDYSSDESKTVTVDAQDGVANYIGNDGDISNGKDYGKDSTAEVPG